MWLLTLDNLIFLSFEDMDFSSNLVDLIEIDEHDTLKGSYYELEKIISPSLQGY